MEIKNIEFTYDTHNVLNDISFKVEREKITTIIGANGCGKSTLFNVMTKNLKPQKGSICIDGENIEKISLKRFAKMVSIVHQYNTAPNDISVETLVGYGRLAYKKWGQSDKEKDEKYIQRALEATETEKYRKKKISELSGGQRQRVWIAMALAQNTNILLLDEPTTYLDIKYQIEILKLIKRLNSEYKITILMVLHDINQAVYYSDNIIAMKDGRIIGMGKSEEIIDKKLIFDTYGVELDVENIGERKFVITV